MISLHTNPVAVLDRAVRAALLRDLRGTAVIKKLARSEGMPRGATKTDFRRPGIADVDVVMFLQSWPTTILGYGGFNAPPSASKEPDSAYTVIVRTVRDACVYFGSSRLAYRCNFDEMTPEQLTRFEADIRALRLLGRVDAVRAYAAEIVRVQADASLTGPQLHENSRYANWSEDVDPMAAPRQEQDEREGGGRGRRGGRRDRGSRYGQTNQNNQDSQKDDT